MASGVGGHAVLVHVRGVDHGLDGQQAAVGQDVLILVGKVEVARGLLLLEVRDQRLAHLDLPLELFVAALCVFLRAVEAALDDLDVGEDQLELKV